MTLVEALDAALNQPSVHRRNHELDRLAEMFTERSLKGLRDAFNSTDDSGASDYQVAFGWIDKRPYAEAERSQHRVELGDLAIIFLREVNSASNPNRKFEGRCALMQAKLQNDGVGSSLKVLFGKEDPSSTHQQALLSCWGQIELFSESRGGNSLGTYSLQGGDQDYGWFMAAHRDSKLAAKQGAAWLCGEPAMGTSCKHTIGEVIATVAQFASLDIGVKCSLTPELQGSGQGDSEWSKLVATLIRLCVSAELPDAVQRIAGRKSRLEGIMEMVANTAMLSKESSQVLPDPHHGRDSTGRDEKMGMLLIVRTVTEKF